MITILNNIEQVLETGYEILIKLEEKDPDLDKVKELYKYRLHTITKLNQTPDYKLNNLTGEKRKASKDLFTRLQLLEKELTKSLTALQNKQRESLKKFELHKKARLSYTKGSAKLKSPRKKILDLKSDI